MAWCSKEDKMLASLDNDNVNKVNVIRTPPLDEKLKARKTSFARDKLSD